MECVESRVGSAECKVWSAKCGLKCEICTVWRLWSVTVCSVECGVWSVECGVENVKCGV